MNNNIRVTKKSIESPLYFEGLGLVARMPNDTQRIRPAVTVLGFSGKNVLCHVFIKESVRMFFCHEGLDQEMIFNDPSIYAMALLLTGEVCSSYEETRRSGVTIKRVVVRFKGEDFILTTGSSFEFKSKGRWNPDEVGSSDGLRPNVEGGGVQVCESNNVHFPNSIDLERLKGILE